MMLFIHNAIFRGAGDAVIAMRTLWIANGINLVLDPCLIFGWGPFPELGVTGAAVATTCGRGTGVIYQLWALRKGSGRVRLRGDALAVDFAIMLRLLRLSGGSICQFLIATSSWVVLMRIMNGFGSEAVAGYTIAIRIIVFTLLPSWGLCNAAATLVGQNLGAGLPDRAERAVWMTGRFNMTFLALVMLVFLAMPRPLVAIFTGDPAVLDLGAQALRIISCGYVFYAWGMVLTQAFNGAGDTMTPTWINLGSFWLLQIPMAWVLATHTELGPAGVFWSVAVAESVLAVWSLLVFRRGKWKERKV
jgi:putative MATE family efflux protein